MSRGVLFFGGLSVYIYLSIHPCLLSFPLKPNTDPSCPFVLFSREESSLMPSDVFCCLTNDFIFPLPGASDLFLSTTPQYFTRAEKCLSRRGESISEDVFISPHLFSNVETLWAVIAALPSPPPEGKISVSLSSGRWIMKDITHHEDFNVAFN